MLFLSCEEYSPVAPGEPETNILIYSIDESSITLSWEGNEFSSDFSYRLEPLDYPESIGIDTTWSDWSTETSIILNHLDEGNYLFYVKSRLNIETEEEVADIMPFSINAITGPALRMYPRYQEVFFGSACEMLIYIEDVVDLIAVELDISYNDATTIQLEISRGDLLNNSEIFFTSTEEDGVMSIITSPEGFSSLNGNGVLAKLTFTVIGSDTLSFLSSSVFKNSDGETVNILDRVEGIVNVSE